MGRATLGRQRRLAAEMTCTDAEKNGCTMAKGGDGKETKVAGHRQCGKIPVPVLSSLQYYYDENRCSESSWERKSYRVDSISPR